jgi:hypothetical protein
LGDKLDNGNSLLCDDIDLVSALSEFSTDYFIINPSIVSSLLEIARTRSCKAVPDIVRAE